jgi:hypothetical protein
MKRTDAPEGIEGVRADWLLASPDQKFGKSAVFPCGTGIDWPET